MWSILLYGLAVAFMAVMIAGMAIVTREIFNLRRIEGFSNYEGFETTSPNVIKYKYTQQQTVEGTCTCTGPIPPGLDKAPTTSFSYDSSSYVLKLNKDEINVVRIAVIMYWIFIIIALIGGIVVMMG